MSIHRVGVVGAGTMGAGIAEVFARGGLRTVVAEATPELAERGRARIVDSLDRAAAKGKLAAEDRDAAVGRLTATTDLADLAGCDLVVEAIIESFEAKRDLFRTLDALLAPGAILATNTSSIPIVQLAVETGRPGRVLGMHFFNPAPVQPLVEVVRSLLTDDDAVAAVRSLAEGPLGKVTIEAKDQAGFVVNRLLVPYLLSAVAMFEAGVASREDIDAGMRNGCAHPMGPLELCDLVGNDIVLHVADVLFDEYRMPQHAAPPLLRRMVAAGRLGRKTGSGFYDYGSSR
jgi:3-hydroxybutyryl-CoA dehydrogenase